MTDGLHGVMSGAAGDDAPLLTAVKGVGPATAEKLAAAGIESVAALAAADAAAVAAETGLAEPGLAGWIEAAAALASEASDGGSEVEPMPISKVPSTSVPLGTDGGSMPSLGAHTPSSGRSGRRRLGAVMDLLAATDEERPEEVVARVSEEDLADGLQQHDWIELDARREREKEPQMDLDLHEEEHEFNRLLAAKARRAIARRDAAADRRTQEMLGRWEQLDKRRVVRPIRIDMVEQQRVLARRIIERRNRDDRLRVTRQWPGSNDQPFATHLYTLVTEAQARDKRAISERPMALGTAIGCIAGILAGAPFGFIGGGALSGAMLGFTVTRFIPVPGWMQPPPKQVAQVDPQSLIEPTLGLSQSQLSGLKEEIHRYRDAIKAADGRVDVALGLVPSTAPALRRGRGGR